MTGVQTCALPISRELLDLIRKDAEINKELLVRLEKIETLLERK